MLNLILIVITIRDLNKEQGTSEIAPLAPTR